MEKHDRNRTEWIEQYLLHQLKAEELDLFHQYLQTDPLFRQEVEVQQALLQQARQVGRDAQRRQLQEMHQRLALPWPVTGAPRQRGEPGWDGGLSEQQAAELLGRHTRRFQFTAIAATISLLLIASLVGYYLYFQPPGKTAQRQPAVTAPLRPQVAMIPLEQQPGDTPDLGFGKTGRKDTTVAVLLYPAAKGSRTYQFDDTLRLYGAFVPARLSLRLDQKTGLFTLREDSLSFPLQRYQSRQALQRAPGPQE